VSDTTGPVRVELDGEAGVGRLTLARPDKLNALNDDLRAGLHAAVRTLADRDDVRVVVVAGAGRAFSAGADLAERIDPGPTDLARRRATGRWQRVLEDLERLPQVTVARLHSHVIGGAGLLAAACDLRVASDDLSFAIPEVAIGIPLTWAGLPRLVREIGLPRTRDLVMTGRRLGAAEAEAWGLVHRVAPAAELDAAVDGLVAGLLSQPPAALAMTVDALRALGRAGVRPGDGVGGPRPAALVAGRAGRPLRPTGAHRRDAGCVERYCGGGASVATVVPASPATVVVVAPSGGSVSPVGIGRGPVHVVDHATRPTRTATLSRIHSARAGTRRTVPRHSTAGAPPTAGSLPPARTTSTTPAPMRIPAGTADTGGTSSNASHASTAAPTISNRIATDTSVGLVVLRTRFTTVCPSSCGPTTIATSAHHVVAS